MTTAASSNIQVREEYREEASDDDDTGRGRRFGL